MDFIPAGEIIGAEHQVRTVKIAQSPDLPDGEYAFIDMYCTDPSCDCRKTMIQVVSGGKVVAIINYGWEKPSFYAKWMGGDPDLVDMAGSSIDITSPDVVNREGMLVLFRALLNETWKARFKLHYKLVKASLTA